MSSKKLNMALVMMLFVSGFSFGCCGAYGKLLDDKLGLIPPLPGQTDNGTGEEMPPAPPDNLPLNGQATGGDMPPPPPTG